ncbi:hypothetical protein LEP1GSC062_4549 [Leptospira alexanderi serovar Manhao 3 str. L 60]|uniref:Endonuclease n=1 Tax=Leptospira alexanderi serovar Manhao 3 str. L 60 TaxID=1049759 RepID=V6I8C7_9LEPT|nr:hypothetical protein LEP1GSC062_4549 [Leptospira alexanderi serovar Manhao 3 str. L 60]
MGWLKKIAAIFGILFGSFLILVYSITYHPDQAEPANILCNENAPILKTDSKVKLLVWNVQYLAGKKEFFGMIYPKETDRTLVLPERRSKKLLKK